MAHILTNGDNTVTVYGAFAPRYVRTDKNGTKIYHDVNCPRCMGHGDLDKWQFTGRICYACGGEGLRRKPLEVKVYTKEYAEKLEARRAAKAAKEAAEAAAHGPSEDELKRRAEEARSNVWQNEGFTRGGTGYLYTGNTYPIREKLRAAGGRWCNFLKGWIAPADLGTFKGVKIEQVNATDLCNGTGYIDPEKCWNR